MLAVIIPTNRCNLRCAHCLRSQYSGDDLNLDNLKKFLAGFEEYRLGNEFSITGGEPTMHNDFSGILNMLKEFDFRGNVVTNGQNHEKILELTNFAGMLNYVLLSLEGPNSAVNDKIRGEGSFKKALKTIKILRERGMPIHIRTTLNAISSNFVEEMMHFSAIHGISLMHFSIIHLCVKGDKNSLLLTQKKCEEIYRKYEKTVPKYPNLKSMFSLGRFVDFTYPEWRSDRLCRPMKGELTLKPNGLVSFCCDLADWDFSDEKYHDTNQDKLDHILGDLKKEDFGEILNRRKKIIDNLIKRRAEDSYQGNLKGMRRFICENCRFYFYKED
jgi:MoaA/NifB/PqqE/SkfB family radical SAM enzyme